MGGRLATCAGVGSRRRSTAKAAGADCQSAAGYQPAPQNLVRQPTPAQFFMKFRGRNAIPTGQEACPTMKSLVLFLLLARTMFGAATVNPRQLRCEYRVNPQGIDATEPRLSWVLTAVNAKARGLRQTAYRVLAASSEAALRANTGGLWDSGKIASADSIHVVYRGKPL